MTPEEKVIATGYTGINFCGDFNAYMGAVELRLKRPVLTHELAELQEEIKEAFREDFLKICRDEI